MVLVHAVDDASAAMSYTANGAHEEYVEASMLPGTQGLY